MDNFNEQKLIEIAEPYLDFCRNGDWEHAKRVVRFVKELGEGRSDLPVLITAAYIHDIGWYKVLPKGNLDLDEMLKHEEEANQNSSVYVGEVLQKLNHSESDIKIVLRLVEAADNHKASLEDEKIIVDADNLSKLFIEHLRQKYQPESYRKLINLWEEELANRISTEKGKAIYPKLLTKLKNDVLVELSNITYKGVIIEESLEDKDVLKDVRILSTKVESVTEKHKTPWIKQWTLHTVEVSEERAKDLADKISHSLDRGHGGSWYADFKTDTHQYIIFRDKVFFIDRYSKEQYDEAKQYGISLGIPEYQVNFKPEIKR